MRKSMWFLAPATLLAGMCAQVGSQEEGARPLALAAFDQVEASSALVLVIHVGEPARGLISGPADEIARVRVRQTGGQLSLDLGKGWDLKGEIRVELWTPALKELELSGATRAEVTGLQDGTLGLDISGASRASLAGQLEGLDLELSGAAALEARDCPAQRADVELSGASRARITVRKELSAECSGASSLEYWGRPVLKSMDSTGASTVKSRDGN